MLEDYSVVCMIDVFICLIFPVGVHHRSRITPLSLPSSLLPHAHDGNSNLPKSGFGHADMVPSPVTLYAGGFLR